MSRCIVNVSTEKYWKGQERLLKSIWNNSPNIPSASGRYELDVQAPLHKDFMYAFKPYVFNHLCELEHSVILWLDASMYVLKDLTPIFEQIERDGYFFQDSGWTNERWTPPHVKEYFGTNEGGMLSSGVLGLDMSSEIGRTFFEQWMQASNDGMFNGDYQTSRHDQTCASLIAYKLGMKLIDNNTFWTYGKAEGVYPDNILIVADGIS